MDWLSAMSGWAVGLSHRVEFWKRRGLQMPKAEGLRADQGGMGPRNEQNQGALLVHRLYGGGGGSVLRE